MAEAIIDAHTHFYDPSRPQGVPWPPADWPLHRVVLPQHWREVARPHGVVATLAVEASEWREDNAWLLDLADQTPDILGVIGNLDPFSETFQVDLERFSSRAGFRGVRWRHDLVRVRAESPACRSAAVALAAAGLVLEVNGPSWMTWEVAALAAAFPDLRIVIDHAGLPGDPSSLKPDWFDSLQEASQHPSVSIKVSGLIEQTDQARMTYGDAPRQPAVYEPILEHCWNCFGQERLVFASNWPACELGGSYSDAFHVLESFFRARGGVVSDRYFRRNALEIYGLRL